MRDLLDYRSEFPILEHTTYLINHSLGGDAGKGGGAARRVRADVARAGNPRLGRGLVGDADDGRRPDRPHHRRTAGLDRDAPERRDRRGRRPLLLPARAGAEPGRLRARQLPVRPLPLPGAARPRGRCLRGRRRDRGGDRRAHAARPDQPRPLQVGGDPGRRADRPARARGGRVRDPRRLPVGGDRAARRHCAERRLRRRRIGQVAVRRPRQRLALRPPGPRRAARADRDRLAGARSALRLRGGDALRRRRRALPDRNAERPRALCGDGRLRPDRGDRRRADPRQLAPPDRPADPAGGSRRLRDREPSSARAPRRHGHGARGRLPGRPQGALGATDPLRLPAGRRESGSARTTSPPTRSSSA